MAPLTVDLPDEEDDEWDTSKGLRIMALSYVPDYSQAAFACMIAADGECTDYLRLPNILRRKNGFREEERLLKVCTFQYIKYIVPKVVPPKSRCS